MGNVSRFILIVSIVAGAGWRAAAQDSAGEAPPQSVGGDVKEDLLAGPAVEEEDSALPADFSGGDRRPVLAVPPEQWMRVVRGLTLTPEQSAAIDEVEGDVRQKVLEFRRTHGEELREIERTRREANGRGERLSPELQRRAQQIMSQMPSMIEAQEEIWTLLDADQQAQVSSQLEEIRRLMIEERQQRMSQQMEESREAVESMVERERETMREDRVRERDDNLDERGKRRLRFLRQRQIIGR